MILSGSTRSLSDEVATEVARYVRKRETSKPKCDSSRNDTIVSQIPPSGDISPPAVVQLLTKHKSFPPAGVLQHYGPAAANSTDSIVVGSNTTSDTDTDTDSDAGMAAFSSSTGPYTDPNLQPGSIVEFWWPKISFVGMITRRGNAGEEIDQITCASRQSTIFHRPSAYCIIFEDETLVLCLPRERRYDSNTGSGGAKRSLNDWSLLSDLPHGHPNIASMAVQLGFSTVTPTIASLTFRAEPVTTDFRFSMPTPLGISFVLDTNGQMRVHSFCEVLPGVPGPAQYSVSQGPTRKLHACDLLLQVIKPKYTPALARICTHTHSHQQVGNTVVAGLSATQQTVLVQALVGPVTLRISPTFAPPPPVVNVVGPTTPAAVVPIPLPPQPQTAPERETAVSLSCICSFLAFTGAWCSQTRTTT